MKWVLRLVAVLIIFVGIALAGFVLLPSDRIAAIASDRITEATGRDIRITGEVRPSIWPELGVRVGGVEVDGTDGEVMLSANAVGVGVELWGLLSGDIRIRGIEIDTPVLRLTANEEGGGNWSVPESEEAANGAVPAFSLDRLVLVDGRVRFTDAYGAETDISGINLTASLPEFSGPLEAAFEASALGKPISGRGQVASAEALFGGARTEIGLNVEAGVNVARFSGNATLPGLIDGDVSVDLADPGFLPGLDALPEGLGARAIAASAGLAFADGALALAGLSVTLDDNRITGAADITLDEPRPRVDADLDLGDFNLAAVDTPADAGNVRTGWSKDPIDVSALGLVDGRIRVSADSLALGTARLGQTILTTTIEDRRSVTRIERMVAYEGAISGEMILNGRGRFSTRLDVAGSALAISRLLSELIGYDRLVAAGDLQLNVLGSGPHLDAVMNSLDGQGAFNVGAGELIGLDIVGMLRNLDPSYVGATTRTIFDEITVSFRVEQGVVIYDDLRLEAPLFRAVGTGSIGLGGQTLDMRLMPELLGGERAGIRVPLTIRGTWDAPKIGLDVEGLMRQTIEGEIGRRLQSEGADRLGVTVEEGQSVEDAVRGRVEEELRRGLGGLLGR